MNASRNTASLWVYKTHKHLSQSQCAWTPIRACADCLHCLVSITAQRQGRKASLFGTTASSLADGVKSKYQYFSFQITSVDCLFSCKDDKVHSLSVERPGMKYRGSDGYMGKLTQVERLWPQNMRP